VNLDHEYAVHIEWTGNLGAGTQSYRGYSRDHTISAEGNPDILASADRTFHGSAERWNPEEMLLAALSDCHMLSYLHSAVRNGIVVTAYEDDAVGFMRTSGDGGAFTSVTLRPLVTISAGDPDVALAIHADASANCFIASSVNFPVHHEPRVQFA
jgi:organic hydroperoxide reductase OsmC/OhrA